jgi:hypothetical protein
VNWIEVVQPHLVVLLGQHEVWVAVGPPAEHVAVRAQQLGLELLLAPAPRLHEVVLLRVAAARYGEAAQIRLNNLKAKLWILTL